MPDGCHLTLIATMPAAASDCFNLSRSQNAGADGDGAGNEKRGWIVVLDTDGGTVSIDFSELDTERQLHAF